MADIIDDDLADPVLDGIIKKLPSPPTPPPPPPPTLYGYKDADYLPGDPELRVKEWIGARFHLAVLTVKTSGSLAPVLLVGVFGLRDLTSIRDRARAVLVETAVNGNPPQTIAGARVVKVVDATGQRRYGILIGSEKVNGNPYKDQWATAFAAYMSDPDTIIDPTWDALDTLNLRALLLQ